MPVNPKKVSRIINIVVLIAVCIGGFFLYMKINASSSKVAELNHMQGLCSDGQWQECLNEYEKLSIKYPEIKGQYQEQISSCYQGLAQEKYTKAISLSTAERAAASGEICSLFEKAAGISKLSQGSIENYCDSLMDAGNFDKARQLIKDAEARSDIDASKLSIYKISLQRKK